jgi:hypothetical protein
MKNEEEKNEKELENKGSDMVNFVCDQKNDKNARLHALRINI